MNLSALLVTLAAYMSSYFASSKAAIQTLVNRLNTHVADRDNPHATTKAHVGLSEVQNYPPATKAQAEQLVDNQTVLTPRRMDQSMEANIYTPLIAILDKAIADLE